MELGDKVFSHILPFHLIWSANGVLETVSPPVRRLWALQENQVPEVHLERPFAAKLNPVWFADLTDMVLTIHCPSAPGRPLRGELVSLPNERWLLCALPPMGRVSDLEGSGLKLSDLPLHSGLGDALIAAEAAHVSLEESQAALRRLEKLNRSLSAINEAFGRFVPRPFLEALGIKSPLEAKLGARATTQTTVLFADLRNFTSLSEQLDSEEIFAFINRHLERVAPCIRKHEGFVVHYLGDGILALFNGSPENAIRASIDMQAVLKAAVETERIGSKLLPGTTMSLGIGLHYGHIEMGIVGESGRWDCSVISDAVNTAYRIEGLTKLFGAEILFTSELHDRMLEADRPRSRRLGRVKVKGKTDHLDVFEVLDSLPPEICALRIGYAAQFSEAIAAFEKDDLAAASFGFQACLAADPSDHAARHYLDRCANWPPRPKTI